MALETPAGHPPIDWDNWSPPGEDDVRSPCPMLNVLANHSILPHNGRGITKQMALSALENAINLSPGIANVFVGQALKMNPDKKGITFDLDHVNEHGVIEHDSSLSRSDYALGNNHTYDPTIWTRTIETYGDKATTNFHLASKARYERLMTARKAHEALGKPFQYGPKEFILSYGESALFLGILGDPQNGQVPVSYVKALFEEERMPTREGWTKLPTPLTQTNMNHLIFSLAMANEHKIDEMRQVGIGTFTMITGLVSDMLGGQCTVM